MDAAGKKLAAPATRGCPSRKLWFDLLATFSPRAARLLPRDAEASDRQVWARFAGACSLRHCPVILNSDSSMSGLSSLERLFLEDKGQSTVRFCFLLASGTVLC